MDPTGHSFKVGDKVTLGVLPHDTLLDAIVDGFYREFVVISFRKDGLWLSVTELGDRTKARDTSWYYSMMIVHPANLRHRDK